MNLAVCMPVSKMVAHATAKHNTAKTTSVASDDPHHSLSGRERRLIHVPTNSAIDFARLGSLLAPYGLALSHTQLRLGVIDGLKLRDDCFWQRVAHAGRAFLSHLRAEPHNPFWLVALHDGKQARSAGVPEKSPKSYRFGRRRCGAASATLILSETVRNFATQHGCVLAKFFPRGRNSQSPAALTEVTVDWDCGSSYPLHRKRDRIAPGGTQP